MTDAVALYLSRLGLSGNLAPTAETLIRLQRRHLDTVPYENLAIMLGRPDSVVAAVSEIARADGAVLVHCAAGKDRTGTVVALALDASGVPRELIAEDYNASRERIEQIIARLRSSETYRAELEGHDPQAHAPVPGTIERVLELVDEQHGGAAEWLLAHGLDEADLERLRNRIQL